MSAARSHRAEINTIRTVRATPRQPLGTLGTRLLQCFQGPGPRKIGPRSPAFIIRRRKSYGIAGFELPLKFSLLLPMSINVDSTSLFYCWLHAEHATGMLSNTYSQFASSTM